MDKEIIKALREEQLSHTTSQEREIAKSMAEAITLSTINLHKLLISLPPTLKKRIVEAVIHSLVMTYTDSIDESLGMLESIKQGIIKIDTKVSKGK